MSCGWLRVPEDRSSRDSPEISIFVVQLPAREANSNRPIIYLAGGPGDSASADIAWWRSTTLRDVHDIILIDQRGTGFSSPSLNCPEFDTNVDDERLANCRERLLSAGIDLAAYNADSIAQDIADLIAALELDQVNIYARSYGARLALLLAHKLPQSIRVMLLDSAYTGEASALDSAAANTWRSMRLLFIDCRANELCHAAYPMLSTQFSQSAAALNAQPMEVAGILPGAALRLDGESYALLLRNMLADSDRLPAIPALVAAIAERDFAYLASWESDRRDQESPVPDSHSEGLYFSALCADEAALTSSEKIKAGGKGLPAVFLPLVASALNLLADCGSWVDAAERIGFEPPPEELPTLFLTGAYDPITPPHWSDEAARRLSNSWRYVFPDSGHGVLFAGDAECAESIALSFLEQPMHPPDSACLQNLSPPTFRIRQNK